MKDVLDTVRFNSAVYFKHGFCGNWGMNVPNGEYAQFHIVSGGQCTLEIDQQVYELTKGDLVIFPKGHPHRIKANPEALCRPGQAVVKGILEGHDLFEENGEVSSYLICGHYELDRSVSHFILSDLPAFILIRNDDYGRYDLIDSVLNHIMDELSSKKIGHQSVVIRFAEILFISILRQYYTNQPASKSNLFTDEAIYNSVNYIHDNLSATLTIDKLTRISGISRTLFIQRFKRSIGDTPLSYIKTWRLTKAKQLLQYSDFTLSEIGDQIGYGSPSAFNRVFKDMYDIAPNRFRQSCKESKAI